MTLSVQTRMMEVADLGPPDSMPMLGAPLESPGVITGDIPGEIIEGSTYGTPTNLYPYQEQNGYGRTLSPRPVKTVVLENDRLRAVFLPEWGGRLWELFDKGSGTHLLHSPPTIQFANLGLRNAWFAGGIEWNIGTRGHSPTTASPLHAVVVRTPGGQEVLRMWEFDRLREVVFQVDAWLPPDSAVLFVAVRVQNPNAVTVPMYWWTNAAVPEREDTRVIAPADSAFVSAYEGGLSREAVSTGAADWSRPANNARARDFFFDIPRHRAPWIVAPDAHGDGLAMLSTARLRGRKLFVWGRGPGGDRWQRWLSPRGERYAEVQAGLAQTQFQHLEMPAGADWSWLEAYGNPCLSPQTVSGTDWPAVVASTERAVADLVSPAALEAAHAAARSWAGLAPTRSILAGSGWGALEAARRRRHGLGWIDESGTPFAPDTVTAEQRPWLDLLEGGARFDGAPGFVRGEDWEALCAATGEGAAASLHRAIMRHAAGDAADAESLYRHSLARGPSAHAHRGLARLLVTGGDTDGGLEHYRLACALAPHDTPQLIEAVSAALAAVLQTQRLRCSEPARRRAGGYGCSGPRPSRCPATVRGRRRSCGRGSRWPTCGRARTPWPSSGSG
ncbi:DUF5107 domain-containing protein [Lacisediminihabitans sp.]|uniref:DUF5107 domain-containing protein n=1 Tax=Lacisediminihabitans sp. TaxID=2787631 RepID=UPI00374D6A7C